jgi:hypothetical protein
VLHSEVILSISPTCCITNTIESDSKNVTKGHVNNSFISVIFYFIVAQGTETREALQSRAYQKTADTICMQHLSVPNLCTVIAHLHSAPHSEELSFISPSLEENLHVLIPTRTYSRMS